MPESSCGPSKRQSHTLCVPFAPETYIVPATDMYTFTIANGNSLPILKCHQCLTVDGQDYTGVVADAPSFHRALDEQIECHPELFPKGIAQGYRMKDRFVSARLGLRIRRIEVAGVNSTVRPRCVMPYLTALTEQVEGPRFLRKFAGPFWALAHVFGRNPTYWYRLEQSLGRQTCAAGCVLGVSVAKEAGEAALTQAYGVFKDEAQQLEPTSSPKSVNTDGWQATPNAWRGLFPTIVLIRCFLHTYLRVRERSKKTFKTAFRALAHRLWTCYRAPTRASSSQRLRRLHEWARRAVVLPVFMRERIDKLRANAGAFTAAYAFPGAHRTSNLLDRLMQRMDRHLFSTPYVYGSLAAAEYTIRAWALIHNFAPSNPHTVRQHHGLQSPTERLNRFRYHDNWLQNLLISGSLMGGFRAPLNP